ncbi:hypothetical protein RvY_04810 [Ramazzottius varieornatus]|uniref:Ras-GEF domain-containing protein n=1 Tax=Ramazzottius varieornatus TaxID=947166 RepID=A0A1D1UW56_RAMVA|nr:hypothetical protein RvY_04810 [Ramazzottius varieornatus]
MQSLSNADTRRSPENGDHRKYWMEEDGDDAIYGVFLKKIRYRSGCSPSLAVDTSCNEAVSYLEWQTIKVKVLKAATLDRVLRQLINDENELDSGTVNIFLDTYREVTTTAAVVTILLEHLTAARETPRERPIKQLLFTLLENYPEDFTSHSSRVDVNEAVIKMMEYAEHSQDIDMRYRLIQRIAAMSAQPHLSHLEVLEWIQDSQPVQLTDFPADDTTAAAQDLLNYGDKFVAEQLTLLDAELLRRLRPHECLANERLRSTSGNSARTSTVQGTICHFNAVCARVESSLLGDLNMPNALRQRMLIKWIDIAHFLFILKNFSSLTAVISALQAEPIFRLKRLWASLPTEKLGRFKELVVLCSSDRMAATNDLQQGVTATQPSMQNYGAGVKELSTLKITKRTGHRRSHSDNTGKVHGMVPYLGKFLTDLVMLDTALPAHVCTKTGRRLLNFDKCRKEFEILAQIRLYQSAAASYLIEPQDHFRFWFYRALRILDSEDCFSNSFLIEPPPSLTGSCSEISDSSEGRKRGGLLSSGLSTLKRMVSQENLLQYAPLTVSRKNSVSSSQSLDYRRQTKSTTVTKSPYLTDTQCILKISLDGNTGSSVFYGGVNLYKSIMVNDSQKTTSVIRAALDKHDRQHDDPNCYDLVQILSRDEEFVIPFDATVFYAINSGESELKFVLRKKTSPFKFGQPPLPKSRSSSKTRSTKDAVNKWSIKSITRTV